MGYLVHIILPNCKKKIQQTNNEFNSLMLIKLKVNVLRLNVSINELVKKAIQYY